MVGELSPWHLLIVAVVFMLLFGSRKLPDAARSLGRSMRIFKSEIRGMQEDDVRAAASTAPPAAMVTDVAAAGPAAPAAAVVAGPQGSDEQSG